jgi:hypothetical protein
MKTMSVNNLMDVVICNLLGVGGINIVNAEGWEREDVGLVIVK